MKQYTVYSAADLGRQDAPSHKRVCDAARCGLQPLVANIDSSGHCLLQGLLYCVGEPLQHKGI